MNRIIDLLTVQDRHTQRYFTRERNALVDRFRLITGREYPGDL